MRRKRWISQLIRGLRDEDEEVRAEAADRLGELGPAASRALPSLVEAVADEDFSVRYSAIRALGRIGIDSDEVVSALLEEEREGSCDETCCLASVALLALDACPGDIVVEVVVPLLEDSHDKEDLLEVGLEMGVEVPPDGNRMALAEFLGRYGQGSLKAIRALHVYAESWNSDESGVAILALGEVSAGTGLAIPALIDILTGWTLWYREFAAGVLMVDEDRALCRFKPTQDIISRLIGALADSFVDGDVQSAAEHVLRRTGSLDEETLIELRDAFRDLVSPDFDPERFEHLNPRARQLAIPALSELVCNECCQVAEEAEKALGRLAPH